MDHDPKTRREVQAVSRRVCIILWTVILAPVLAILVVFPLCWILFFIFPGYMFFVGPSESAAALYLVLWISSAFLLGYRGHLPGTAISTPQHCAKCDYDLRGNTSRTCPECGEPIGDRG